MSALAGPLAVAAVRYEGLVTEVPLKIEESKAAKGRVFSYREQLRWFLPKDAWAVELAHVPEIAEFGIQGAWERAAARAVSRVTRDVGIEHRRLYVDGKKGIPGIGRQDCIPKADEKFWVCAAASIFARAALDEWHKNAPLAKKYQWGVGGYESRAHIELLRTYGPSVEHRAVAIRRFIK